METVDFKFYSYDPRMWVSFRMRLHTMPVVGDVIHVDARYIKNVSLMLIDRDYVKRYGKTFIVLKRVKHMTSQCGEDWRIELGPVEPLRNKK